MQTAGFFRLAGYIGVFSQIPVLGRFAPPKNSAVASSSDPQTVPIAMTSPVMMTPTSTPRPIAMTSPVLMTPSAGGAQAWAEANEEAEMSFVLPRSLFKTAADAPVPTNPNVSIRDRPGRIVAVLQLHGRKADVPVELGGEEYMEALMAKLSEHPEFHARFKSKGTHEVLGYMAPMAPMQIRELHVELEPLSKL